MPFVGTTALTELWSRIRSLVSTKQDTLVSGTNIKTINNESILGSGNISVSGGGGTSMSTVKRVEYPSGSVSISSGTRGTRGAQLNVNIEQSGWTPVSVCISYVQDSSSVLPVVFFGNTASTSNYTSVYCNFYRCTTSAYSNATPLRFTVTYVKDIAIESARGVTPSLQSQTVLPSEGYDVLSEVDVAAIPVVRTNNAQGGQTVEIAGERSPWL